MSATPPRYLCIHGHFYQPPRENPWLEAVEVQDSAAPFHDWNERVTRECYAPNSRARFVDAQGKIINLINNYAWMSYNFGPTLLAWLAEAAPEVLHGIVEGDRLSRERRSGHGNALAQVYNHAIMPLATDADKRTQVLWGIADFRHRFGRDPEGMWLAETAVDLATLEALAAAGIRFTILAPPQAKRWRHIGEANWAQVPEGIDPSRAYLCRLPSGRTIALFFYDGIISRQVAFERLLDSGEDFLAAMLKGFDPGRRHAQLVHIATDGESYGHHHPHGDMALAYVLYKLTKDDEVHLTNYGEFLERHPPEWEVEIQENTSWSCVHGLERWRSNCGCNMGRGWQQEWRAPLRRAMDLLKKRLDDLFIKIGAGIFPDPWGARNGFIEVILDRSEESVRRFLQNHARSNLDAEQVRRALWLMEMQRHGLLMYTSCGWFFDEISGLETTQCLRYAARAIQLARHFDQEFEEPFVGELEKAPSNLASYKNGRVVWEQVIRPERIDLDRVLAHYAISLIFGESHPADRVYCYDLESQDQFLDSRGTSHLAVGRLRVRSRLTWNEAETSFVVLHYGGLDFHAVLRLAPPPDQYEAFKQKLLNTFHDGSLADVTTVVAEEFKGETHRLDDLFVEEQRRIISIVLQERFTDYQQEMERLADEDEDLLNRLGRLHYPIPKPMRAAAAVSWDRRLLHAIAHLDAEESMERIRFLHERGKAWGYQIDRESLGQALNHELTAVLGDLNPLANLTESTLHVGRILDAAALFEIQLDLWQAQNRLLDAYTIVQSSDPPAAILREAFAKIAARLNMNSELLGWRP